MPQTVPLSQCRTGDRGTIQRVGRPTSDDPFAKELERRLLEMGLVEGARFEVLHEGLFGRDPLAIKVDDMRVALRRREAGWLEVAVENGAA